LSYTWGEPQPLKTVELYGYPFEVRPNLYDFLMEGREPAYDRIWNVALCCSGTVADLWSWERVMADHQPLLAYRFKSFTKSGQSEVSSKAADGIDFLALCPLYASRHIKTNNLNPLGPTLFQFFQGHFDDIRDKIYGLQGMVREDQRVQVDYSKPPNEVYVAVAMALVALSTWNEANDRACHELRSLREELNLGPDLLDSFEEVLGIAPASDVAGYAETQGPSVIWTWQDTPGDVNLDSRWDRIMKALPWGEKAMKIIRTLTGISETTNHIVRSAESG
jgi:hypothetical protein